MSGASEATTPTLRKRARSTRWWQLALLGFFGLLFIGAMLADPNQQSDEGSYVRYADHLADGYYTDRDAPDLWFGPGLPVLLVPFALLSAPVEVMRLLGPVALLAAVAVFFSLLRLHVSQRAALVGAVSLALYVPFYILLPSLHSETVAVLLVVLFMYGLTRYLREGRLRFLAMAGAALGYLALTRIVFGWIVAAGLIVWSLAWIFRRSKVCRHLALTHVVALAVCIPWLTYTYTISGNVFYWGSSGGQSLYWMAAPYDGHLGDWHARAEVFSNPNLAPDRPQFAKLKSLDQIESDEVLQRDALALIKAHPQRYARHILENLSRLLFNTPYSFTPQKLSTAYYIVPNALLLATFAWAITILWLRRRVVVRVPTVLAPFLVVLVLGVGVQALLAGYARMLAPLVPILIWVIVFSLDTHIRFASGEGISDRRVVSVRPR